MRVLGVWVPAFAGTTRKYPARRLVVIPRQQRGVAAGRRGVDGHRLLCRKTWQIMRAAGLWAGAGQAVAAERLHADHGADHVAIDVDVADLKAVDRVLDGVVDPRMNAEGQPVAGAR